MTDITPDDCTDWATSKERSTFTQSKWTTLSRSFQNDPGSTPRFWYFDNSSNLVIKCHWVKASVSLVGCLSDCHAYLLMRRTKEVKTVLWSPEFYLIFYKSTHLVGDLWSMFGGEVASILIIQRPLWIAGTKLIRWHYDCLKSNFMGPSQSFTPFEWLFQFQIDKWITHKHAQPEEQVSFRGFVQLAGISALSFITILRKYITIWQQTENTLSILNNRSVILNCFHCNWLWVWQISFQKREICHSCSFIMTKRDSDNFDKSGEPPPTKRFEQLS